MSLKDDNSVGTSQGTYYFKRHRRQPSQLGPWDVCYNPSPSNQKEKLGCGVMACGDEGTQALVSWISSAAQGWWTDKNQKWLSSGSLFTMVSGASWAGPMGGGTRGKMGFLQVFCLIDAPVLWLESKPVVLYLLDAATLQYSSSFCGDSQP